MVTSNRAPMQAGTAGPESKLILRPESCAKQTVALRPRRRQAMKELSDQIDTLRQKLWAADDALAGLSATEAGEEAAGSPLSVNVT